MRIVAVVLLAALAVACQRPPGQVLEDVASEAASAAEDIAERVASNLPSARPAPEQPPQAVPPPPAAPPPAPGSDATAQPAPAPRPPAAPAPADRAGLGALCRPYLRAEYPRLVVEIDVQAGAELTPGAVEHLLAVLRSVVAKPGGVVTAGGNTVAGGSQTWSVEQIAQTAAANRSQFSSSEQVVLYVLALRGQLGAGGTLGVAYNASEFAVFPDEMGALATLLGGPTALERAVLVHEAGHLLCLVNVTYDSAIPHEDAEHPHHSNDRTSVMYWAIETSAVAQLFSGPPPDDFTAADRADLDGLRTGRY